jgi:hypothetical protein
MSAKDYVSDDKNLISFPFSSCPERENGSHDGLPFLCALDLLE